MIDLNLKTKVRTQPFFGRWQYYALFHLPEAHVLRKLDHDHIDRSIRIRREWQNRTVNFGGSWYGRGVPITNSGVANLHGICDFFLGDNTPRKIMIYSHNLYVYANDLNLFDRIERTGTARRLETVQVKLSGTPGTVVLKNPVHKLRSYFSGRDLDPRARDSVKQFLTAQPSIRLSPALTHWIEIEYRFTAPYFFIDHDDTGTTLMLNMIAPGLIRKTLDIEAAK